MTTRSWSMSVSSEHLPIAMATRPQFGSAPCTAVLTSGEFTIALATRRAWASSRAPSTRTSMSVVAPSPSRAICRVSDRADVTERLLERGEVDRAGGAVGEDGRGVAGRGVGVDADAR